MTGQSAAQNNALATIHHTRRTPRLLRLRFRRAGSSTSTTNGGAEDETISYLNPGGYVTTDADGNKTTVYFNLYGATAETIDPLGNVTRYYYDSNLNSTKVVGPGGTYLYLHLRCQRQPHRARPTRSA